MAQDKPEDVSEATQVTESSGEPEVDAAEVDAAEVDAPEIDDDPEAPADPLTEALSQIEALKDQALRAQAEVENVRRRAARDVEQAHKYAVDRFAADLLPVLDSLEKSVEAAAEVSAEAGADSDATLVEGIELSLKLFLASCAKAGMAPVDPHGEPFDPQLHEAMAMVPNPDAEPNSVMEVMQKGYTLNGRLVRAAKVVVVRGDD